jgi:lipoprotein-anchoring transpeptidase ErfK/SrfK
MSAIFDRRGVLAGIGVLLGGCARQGGFPLGSAFYPLRNAAAYGPINDHGHEIPGLDLTRIDPSLLRQEVPFAGPYRPGTIVVNIGERRLYLVQPGGVAMRYAVGVGREEALNFRGSAVIGRKAEWPHWTPTADMIRRMPIYAHYASGLPGRHQQSAGRTGALSLPRQSGYRLPPARNHRTGDDRHQGVERLHTSIQSRHHRSP